MAAFRHAIQAGVTVIEADAIATKDDRVIINHDLNIDSAICSLDGKPVAKDIPIRSLTFAELQRYDCGSTRNPAFPRQVLAPGARMPALEEVLELVQGQNVQLMLETKMDRDASPTFVNPEHIVALIDRQLRRYGVSKQIILQSFDHRTLAVMHRINPDVTLCLLNPAKHLDNYVDPSRALGGAIQFVNFRVIEPGDVKTLHGAGIRVFSGTTNDRQEWKRLTALGVDGILTDDPAGLQEFLKAKPAI